MSNIVRFALSLTGRKGKASFMALWLALTGLDQGLELAQL